MEILTLGLLSILINLSGKHHLRWELTDVC